VFGSVSTSDPKPMDANPRRIDGGNTDTAPAVAQRQRKSLRYIFPFTGFQVLSPKDSQAYREPELEITFDPKGIIRVPTHTRALHRMFGKPTTKQTLPVVGPCSITYQMLFHSTLATPCDTSAGVFVGVGNDVGSPTHTNRVSRDEIFSDEL
jgi:hypothetical protein